MIGDYSFLKLKFKRNREVVQRGSPHSPHMTLYVTGNTLTSVRLYSEEEGGVKKIGASRSDWNSWLVYER